VIGSSASETLGPLPTRQPKAAQTGGERAPQFTCASEIGPMSSSHNTDDLVNDMLADMCGLIIKTIALIPPERDDDRLSACAFVLDQINKAVEHIVNADRTAH
jgi:hypothetical protein